MGFETRKTVKAEIAGQGQDYLEWRNREGTTGDQLRYVKNRIKDIRRDDCRRCRGAYHDTGTVPQTHGKSKVS